MEGGVSSALAVARSPARTLTITTRNFYFNIVRTYEKDDKYALTTS